MNELQEAIDWLKLIPDARAITAHRALARVANLGEKIDVEQLSDGLKFAHITDSDGEYLIYVAQQVQAALDITTDD